MKTFHDTKILDVKTIGLNNKNNRIKLNYYININLRLKNEYLIRRKMVLQKDSDYKNLQLLHCWNKAEAFVW